VRPGRSEYWRGLKARWAGSPRARGGRGVRFPACRRARPGKTSNRRERGTAHPACVGKTRTAHPPLRRSGSPPRTGKNRTTTRARTGTDHPRVRGPGKTSARCRRCRGAPAHPARMGKTDPGGARRRPGADPRAHGGDAVSACC
jgi:hypothetical protein